jgi:hypothetical protein
LRLISLREGVYGRFEFLRAALGVGKGFSTSGMLLKSS